MKASIIMPVYNREKYVQEAIMSILEQTMEDLELIVIDDRSTDHTLEVIREIRDPRMKVVEAPFKTNIPMLRNAGIRMAQGKYIGYMDSDDISVPQRLQWECDFLDENPDYGVVYGSNRTFGNYESLMTYPKTNELITGGLPVRCEISNGNSLMRRSTFDLAMLRPEYFVCEDYGFWCDLIRKTKFGNLDKVLLNIRYHSEQTTTTSWEQPYLLNIRAAILKEIFRAALMNLGIDFTEDELEIYSYCFGDTVRMRSVNEMHIEKLTKVVTKFRERLERSCPEYLEGFCSETDRKIGKLIARVEKDHL